jgi:hypothetical protein
MLDIFAKSLMTATRQNIVKVRDVKPTARRTKSRWLPKGHWWVAPFKDIDLDSL